MAEGAGSREQFLPAQYQPALPLDRLILKDGSPGAGDRMELDVLIVGAGPARLPRADQPAPVAQSPSTALNHQVLRKHAEPRERPLPPDLDQPREGPHVVPRTAHTDRPIP